MNTSIEEIMDAAGLQPYYDAQEAHIRKFAKLIVLECERIAKGPDLYNDDWRMPIHYTFDKIKKQFNIDAAKESIK